MKRILQQMASAAFVLLMIAFCNDSSHAEVRCFPNSENTAYYGIAKDGQIILPAEYKIQNTPLSYLIYDDSSEKFGYYDKTSGFLQMPFYDAIYDCFCTDPSAPIYVQKAGRFGYLNRQDGTVAIALQYTGVSNYSEFYNGYALPANHIENSMEIHERSFLIDKNGQEIKFPVGIEPFGHVQNNGLLIIAKAADTETSFSVNYGVGNTLGQVLVYPEYEKICEYSNGYASVRKNGKWGHIDEQGNVIQPPSYELLEEENEGYYFDDNGLATFRLSDESWITISLEKAIESSISK